MPPWCPHCGADMRAAPAVAAETLPGQSEGITVAPSPAPAPVTYRPPEPEPRPRSQLLPLVLVVVSGLIAGVYFLNRWQQSQKPPPTAPAPATASEHPTK
jgi:hypothetical protein